MTPVEILDIRPLMVWAASLSTILSLCTTVYMLFTAGARKNDTRIADLTVKLQDMERAQNEKLTESDRRMQRIEDRLVTVPTAEMIHRIEIQMTTMLGEVGKLDERLKPVASIAERMQEVLIDRSRSAA